jgi:2,3-dihydroxyphenylpropionate 1,2-dioxygenase
MLSSRETVATDALSGGNNLATALSLNACPYLAISFFRYHPRVSNSIEATTILTQRARYPVIPLFINSVAPPVISFRRARQFGEAVGEFARKLGKRTLIIGSGGLSHNPPVPQIATAVPEVAERLIAGRNPTPDARAARQQRTIDAATLFAGGDSPLHPLNPQWDEAFMANLACQDWTALDAYGNAAITEAAGASAHEVKTWVAANAAMNAATGGHYQVQSRYYRAIPEWIAGFAALTGVTA